MPGLAAQFGKAKTLVQSGKAGLQKVTIQKEMFPCPHCEKMFTSSYGRQLHLPVHTGEYKYRCQYCNQGFGHRQNFFVHLSKKHGHIDTNF